MREHDLLRARYQQACIKGSVLTTAPGPEHSPVCERVSQTTSRAASSSSQSALGPRLAGEDHCDPRPIRLGSVSSADESDQLLGKIEKRLGVPATTRSWNTIEKVVTILRHDSHD
jgi:hypothetical protein